MPSQPPTFVVVQRVEATTAERQSLAWITHQIRSMTRSLSRGALTALVAATLLVSTACATKSIAHVLADPARYRDREVQVSGVVADSYSVVGLGAFRIEDRSGQLWVVSDRGVPRKGSKVTVKGRMRDGFNFSGLEKLVRIPAGTVLIASSHRVH